MPGHPLLPTMLLLRRFEERALELHGGGEIAGFLHSCRGEEAVIAGAASVLEPEDAVLTTFRAVPWVLARGGPAEPVMAELLGRVDGCSGGRGGATHVHDVAHGVLGGWGIPGGHAPVAAGVALTGRLTLCQMTAGATAQGVVGETLALAATWELPVVFLVTRDVAAGGPPPARTELFERSAAAGVAGLRCDGMDAGAVARIVGDAVARVRAERRPVLVEALIRRTVDVVGQAPEEQEAEVAAAIDAAVAFARASPEPLASAL
jgi:TPP-dependent pyruvate/acetoin dehydrogenase alpha subunit